MTRAEAEAVLEDRCDHPSIFAGGVKRRLGGACWTCADEANRVLASTESATDAEPLLEDGDWFIPTASDIALMRRALEATADEIDYSEFYVEDE